MNLFSLGAPSWLWEAINSLWLMLCKWIYIGINWFYQVFEKVASVNLFSTEVFKEITSRIYVIMGIAMLFIFAYNLVLMIINPEDKKGSGAMGKVIKETMISLVVVVLLPTIFNYMYIVQSHVLESNIIGQIIMGSVGSTTSDKSNCASDDYDCRCDFTKFEELEQYNNTNIGMFWSTNYTTQGNQDLITKTCENYRGYNGSKITDSQRGAYSIAPTIFSAFYRPTNFTMEDCEKFLVNNDTSVLNNDKDQKICINYYFDVNMSKYTGNITPFVDDSYLNGIISDSTDKSMEFNWPFALIAGGLAVWMFICYAMEIGVRVAKLGLLQILSPIAVMMRVIPGQKEKIFDKWFTHLKNTYLDVFIRLVIIYFSLFAISLVPDVLKTLWISTVTQEAASSSTVSGFFIKTLAMVVVILGILKFAQEAPALIKEFFGDSGRFALKSPKKQLQDNKLAKGAAGGLGAFGAVTAKNSYDSIRGMAKNIKNAKGVEGKIGAALKGGARIVGGVPRGVSQQWGALRSGYKYGKEANNWDEMRKYTFGAASEQMNKPTLGQKIFGDGGFITEEGRGIKNFYSGKYSAFNSPGQLILAEQYDKVADALKKLEDKLDTSNAVKAANNAIDATLKLIQDKKPFNFTFDGKTYTERDTATADGLEKTLEALEKYRKERVGMARQAAFKDAYNKNDDAVLSLFKDYKKEVSDNLKNVNNAISERGGTIIDNVEVSFSPERMSGDVSGVTWKEIREAGDFSQKAAAKIKNEATKQQEISSGKK